MRWLAKSVVQSTISALPREEAVNYWFQRNVSRALPRGREAFELHVREGLEHVKTYSDTTGRALEDAHLYEFGAGWDLVGPLAAYAAGAERQTLIDLRPNLRFELINEAVGRLNTNRDDFAAAMEMELRPLAENSIGSLADLESQFGIRYLAPQDARDVPFPDGSFDLISSTFTMEHIPKEQLVAILQECRRLLSPDGLISCSIDMKDHFSYFDPSIGPYNFLKFSPATWRLLNPGVQYQNRLRLPDYEAAFREAGLDPIASDVRRPTADEVKSLNRVPVANEFLGLERDDLAALEWKVALRATA